MKHVLLTLCVLGISASAVAEEHQELLDGSAYQVVLEGTQAFGEACFVGVKSEGFDSAGRYFAEVETSFSHEGEGPGILRVSLDDKKQLSAIKDDGSQITLQLAEGASGITQASKFAVRWKHGSHYDTGLCSNLKPIVKSCSQVQL